MKKSIPACLILFIIVLFGCSSDDQNTTDDGESNSELYFPPISSDVWETLSLTDLGWNVAAEQPLYDFLDAKGTKAFIILKNGKIVIERYGNG